MARAIIVGNVRVTEGDGVILLSFVTVHGAKPSAVLLPSEAKTLARRIEAFANTVKPKSDDDDEVEDVL